MDRVFLDANVLFSAAYKSAGGLKRLWAVAHEHKAVLITSTYAVEEARRNLKEVTQQAELERLLCRVKIVAAPPANAGSESHGLPAKDIPILQTAIVSEATHLITGDFTHFGFLYGKTIEGVLIIAPADYLGSGAAGK